jgi:hypothetical protein
MSGLTDCKEMSEQRCIFLSKNKRRANGILKEKSKRGPREFCEKNIRGDQRNFFKCKRRKNEF